MSDWTHIRGSLVLMPLGVSQHAMDFVLNEVLDRLPRVTGSEGPMEWHVSRCHGHNMWSTHDSFGEKSNLHDDDYGGFERQSRYIVSLDGNLRDRCFEETFREFARWLTRLAKRVEMSDICVKVSGWRESNGKYECHVISDPEPFRKLWRDYLVSIDDWNPMDVRWSIGWRYGERPTCQDWNMRLVNLVPGGYALASDYDMINGNLIPEEYLEYKGGRYVGVSERVRESVDRHTRRLAEVDEFLKTVERDIENGVFEDGE